ncbi:MULTISPECIES: methyltransferase domain-containing protein [unclassified Caballeronia]|uniref:methyltransferase domain-containing protein n=1 Tax=unclassified Caballeronia TaxID=2646786 RepID=UPI00286B976D|nr:methyltransferase domain-containing protein [Caballeronia sp. LZ008]
MNHYFVGEGIDIGPADDPLSAHVAMFPKMRNAASYPSSQGDLTKMEGVKESTLDFLHSSHSLAELNNPHKALSRWLELLKPGGHAVVTVPDEDLYGKGTWPSRFNRRHKWSFTVHKSDKRLPRSVNVLELIQTMSPVAHCERVTLVRNGYDERDANEDQTAKGLAECAIEIVLRKRAVASPRELAQAASRARSVQEGVAACREALRTYPYHFDLYRYVLLELLRWDALEEVDSMWEECVKRLPGEHHPRLYHVLHEIARGRLQKGFRMREELMARFGWKRRTTVEPPRHVTEWSGQSLEGKAIAIWSEFGLGDEIFFLRFARFFREQCGAKRVIVMCQPPLVELYEASGEADEVVSTESAANLPDIDYWVYPHAIPAHLTLDLEALPKAVPYLRAPSAVPSKLPIVAPNKLKVGLVFKGNPTHENDRARSLPSLAVLDDLLRIPDIEFFSLQKGAGADEAADYAQKHANFHDVGAQVTTMAETAKAIESLDVVLTVDTSVAHVAGAMGKRVWMMLPFYGDWRWHYTREDSPWYPTMRLFRKRHGCDWSEVVARIAGHLKMLRADTTCV